MSGASGRLGGGLPPKGWELVYRCLAGDERDVGAVDAEVVQFACRQAAKFRNRFTVAAPVVVRADEVHNDFLSRNSDQSLSTVLPLIYAYAFKMCSVRFALQHCIICMAFELVNANLQIRLNCGASEAQL